MSSHATDLSVYAKSSSSSSPKVSLGIPLGQQQREFIYVRCPFLSHDQECQSIEQVNSTLAKQLKALDTLGTAAWKVNALTLASLLLITDIATTATSGRGRSLPI